MKIKIELESTDSDIKSVIHELSTQTNPDDLSEVLTQLFSEYLSESEYALTIVNALFEAADKDCPDIVEHVLKDYVI